MGILRSQPRGRVRVNLAHPLARDLCFAWIGSDQLRDLITNQTCNLGASLDGPYLDRKGRVGGRVDFGRLQSTNFYGSNAQTIFAEIFMPSGTGSAGGYVLGKVESAWNYFLSVDAGSQTINYGTGGDSTGVAHGASVGGGLNFIKNRAVPICGTYDKQTAKIYVDGRLYNSQAQTGSFPNNSDDAFAIGARGGAWNSGGQVGNTGIYTGIVLMFKRTLNAEEVAALSANPWQIFVAPEDEHWAAVAAAGASYTLSVAGGAFALTGSAGALVASRRMTAGPAAFALAGAPAQLSSARRLTVAAAGFAVSGISAVLISARRLPGATSSMILAGAGANLTAARRLTAVPGTYAAAGGAAGLIAARKLAAAAGSCSLSVAVARMAAARRLSAAPGAFALTGGAATFTYTPAPGPGGPTYTLTGGTGACLVTFSAARLALARRLVASPGAFSASSSAVRLATRRRLSAAPATYAMSTSTAVLKYMAAGGIVLDASQVSDARVVVFGSGGRTVVFGGGTRVVVFAGGIRVVAFDDTSKEKEPRMANAPKPYFKDGKWFVDKDPDEKSYYVADLTQELTDRGTTVASVEVLVGGVTLTEGPSVQGKLIVVKLEGMDVTDGASNFWTARVTCANTERFDRTTWLNRVDN